MFAIFGPTGVGKTAVALALADALRGAGRDPVAVSADALQVYAGLETLTAAATAAQRARLEHRLVGFLPVTEAFSVAAYARLAHCEIDGLLAAGRPPIVVGGTGLYLRAALAPLTLRPAPAAGVRERWEGEVARRGPEALHAQLVAVAPRVAATIEPQDRHRIVRALELHEAGALRDPDGASQLWTADMRHPTVLAGLTMEREALYARIEARVDAMVAANVAEEVRAADAAGASATACQALGFAEVLAGDVEAMKGRTRRYAKRQLTWMRKLGGLRPIDVTGRDPRDVAAEILATPAI